MSSAAKTSPASGPSPSSSSSSRRSTAASQTRHLQRAAEVNLAMSMAKSRERFRWAIGYLGVLVGGTGIRWLQARRLPVAMLLPVSAVTAWAAWEWDLGYGNKLERVNLETQHILSSEKYKHFGKS